MGELGWEIAYGRTDEKLKIETNKFNTSDIFRAIYIYYNIRIGRIMNFFPLNFQNKYSSRSFGSLHFSEIDILNEPWIEVYLLVYCCF